MSAVIRVLRQDHANMAKLLDVMEGQITVLEATGASDFQIICDRPVGDVEHATTTMAAITNGISNLKRRMIMKLLEWSEDYNASRHRKPVYASTGAAMISSTLP